MDFPNRFIGSSNWMAENLMRICATAGGSPRSPLPETSAAQSLKISGVNGFYPAKVAVDRVIDGPSGADKHARRDLAGCRPPPPAARCEWAEIDFVSLFSGRPASSESIFSADQRVRAISQQPQGGNPVCRGSSERAVFQQWFGDGLVLACDGRESSLRGGRALSEEDRRQAELVHWDAARQQVTIGRWTGPARKLARVSQSKAVWRFASHRTPRRVGVPPAKRKGSMEIVAFCSHPR